MHVFDLAFTEEVPGNQFLENRVAHKFYVEVHHTVRICDVGADACHPVPGRRPIRVVFSAQTDEVTIRTDFRKRVLQ